MNRIEAKTVELRVSHMAETLIASEIIKLAGEINNKIKNGEKIYNLTIGDFNPYIFPIPTELQEEIIRAYRENETNYPPADGLIETRKAVSEFLIKNESLEYNPNSEVLIAAGARPLIYAVYQTLVEPRESVIFPVPSWNNNHYTHLSHANKIEVLTSPENNFMPTADDLKPHLKDAALVSLCSPLNPTGTVFSKDDLRSICEVIAEENLSRRRSRKPLYLMYDQIYWVLTYGDTKHYNPIELVPEMKDYTVFIDGLSKAFAATGVRVGWALGHERVISKMKSILSHLGAWAPKAEQIASARFLENENAVNDYLINFKEQISSRLEKFYEGFIALRSDGFEVDVISPQAAIYLTVKFQLHGKKKEDGSVLETTRDITKYLLEEARVAIVPFYAFGDSENSPWYRLSVGTCRLEEIDEIIESLRKALSKLT
ncbi:MAG: aminotransferase class I/II-fold pyridoxal phosphate-dependent enzyme [Ignavibacteria bacterium]|nr:aminotransferase class I/II-fold pyridoxal phosphate-dependent enzyme [Ignavibacteria bacterium]